MASSLLPLMTFKSRPSVTPTGPPIQTQGVVLPVTVSSWELPWFPGNQRNKTQYPDLLQRLNTKPLPPLLASWSGSTTFSTTCVFNPQTKLFYTVTVNLLGKYLTTPLFMSALSISTWISMSSVKSFRRNSSTCYRFDLMNSSPISSRKHSIALPLRPFFLSLDWWTSIIQVKGRVLKPYYLGLHCWILKLEVGSVRS